MLKAIMIAGTLCLGMVVASPVEPARADADADIGIGLGGGYGSNPYYWQARRGISCRQGAQIVFGAGYKNVRAMDCSGSQYTYMGRRGDRHYKITVRSKNGNIIRVERIRRGGGGWGGGGYGDDYDDGYDDGGYGDDYDDGYDY
jgi:hypothetical protein